VLKVRKEKAVLEAEFEAARPRLLGALLDLFAASLAKLPGVSIPAAERPRMLEYAQLGCAIALAQGKPQDVFLSDYAAVRAEAVARGLEASPVVTALIEWLEATAIDGSPLPARYGEHKTKELFGLLTRPPGCNAWPGSDKGFSDAMKRAAPALRVIGIHVTLTRRGGRSRITITRDKTGALRELHALHGSHANGAAAEPTEGMQSMQSSRLNPRARNNMDEAGDR
jgi:hypothetical protein